MYQIAFQTPGHNSKQDKSPALIMFTLICPPDSQPFLSSLLFLYIQINKVFPSKITKFLLIVLFLIPSMLIDNEVLNLVSIVSLQMSYISIKP